MAFSDEECDLFVGGAVVAQVYGGVGITRVVDGFAFEPVLLDIR
jgi:hypothetical protein